MSIQRMTRIALLSAILYVSKVVLEFLPNIELIVTVFNLFELIQWGFGTWWFSYLYVWPLLCVITMLLKKLIKEEFLIWAIVSGSFGLIFGSLFALFYLFVDPKYALAYWISGLPWDVVHCIGNFVLMLILGKPLYKLLKMLNQKVYPSTE